mmetsp:Transcript_47586/g.146861  ORF Transcript_47586/g.146861 Transcript_47586/m.146861 type:complete len:224 (-) Transcript_47586:1235-1906(-)
MSRVRRVERQRVEPFDAAVDALRRRGDLFVHQSQQQEYDCRRQQLDEFVEHQHHHRARGREQHAHRGRWYAHLTRHRPHGGVRAQRHGHVENALDDRRLRAGHRGGDPRAGHDLLALIAAHPARDWPRVARLLLRLRAAPQLPPLVHARVALPLPRGAARRVHAAGVADEPDPRDSVAVRRVRRGADEDAAQLVPQPPGPVFDCQEHLHVRERAACGGRFQRA